MIKCGMCRLFATMANHPIDSHPLLSGAPQSLFKQSHVDKKRPQGDGWGVGWFERGRPHVFKSAKAMYRDKKNIAIAEKRANGKVVIGHVRWASNPLKLKRDELIGPTHTQPFVHGPWLFAHNGTLFIPKEVAAQLGPWKKYVKGKNDSEVLFYWLLKHVAPEPTPANVRWAIRGLHRIWESCKKSYPIHPYPFHGLNWVLTNGRTLVALCYADPRGFGRSKALCNKKECYYQLRKRVSSNYVWVASEPLDLEPGWQTFRHGELLMATRHGSRIVSHSTKVL
jgi:glutamine amidotransferase